MDRHNENLKSTLSSTSLQLYRLQVTTLPLLCEKFVNFGPLTKKVIGVNHQSRLYSGD